MLELYVFGAGKSFDPFRFQSLSNETLEEVKGSMDNLSSIFFGLMIILFGAMLPTLVTFPLEMLVFVFASCLPILSTTNWNWVPPIHRHSSGRSCSRNKETAGMGPAHTFRPDCWPTHRFNCSYLFRMSPSPTTWTESRKMFGDFHSTRSSFCLPHWFRSVTAWSSVLCCTIKSQPPSISAPSRPCPSFWCPDFWCEYNECRQFCAPSPICRSCGFRSKELFWPFTDSIVAETTPSKRSVACFDV